MPPEVASLVCHAHVDMALSCLGSLQSTSRAPLRLRIHDDGSLTGEDRERLIQGLPDSVVVSPMEADDRLGPLLAAYPHCRAFRERSPLARKLLDVPLLSAEQFAFCDSDVFWFRPFEGLFESLNTSKHAVFMEDNQEAYSLRPWNLLGRNAVRVPRRVNTGLILARSSIIDLDFLEWLLGLQLPSFNRFPLWAEQTCWAALGQRAGCLIWDRTQVRVIQNSGCVDSSLVAGHFTSAVRSLLPAPAGPLPVDPGLPAVMLRAMKSHSLGPIGLALSQLERFRRTRLNIG